MASRLAVEPASEDDWELVELNADYMEEQMLNQAMPVMNPKPLPFVLSMKFTGQVILPEAQLLLSSSVVLVHAYVTCMHHQDRNALTGLQHVLCIISESHVLQQIAGRSPSDGSDVPILGSQPISPVPQGSTGRTK